MQKIDERMIEYKGMKQNNEGWCTFGTYGVVCRRSEKQKNSCWFMVMMGIGLCVLQEFYLIISGRQDHIEMIHWCMGAAPGAVLLLLGKVTGGRIGIGDGMVVFGAGLMTGGILSFRIFIWSLMLIFIFSCVGLLTGKLRCHSCIPFVPFYTMAYIGGWIL